MKWGGGGEALLPGCSKSSSRTWSRVGDRLSVGELCVVVNDLTQEIRDLFMLTPDACAILSRRSIIFLLLDRTIPEIKCRSPMCCTSHCLFISCELVRSTNKNSSSTNGRTLCCVSRQSQRPVIHRSAARFGKA